MLKQLMVDKSWLRQRVKWEKTLEFALEFIEDDELVEITPQNIRIRKFHLGKQERKRINKRK